MPRKYRLRELPDGVLLVALNKVRYEKAVILTKANDEYTGKSKSAIKGFNVTDDGIRKIKEALDVRQ